MSFKRIFLRKTHSRDWLFQRVSALIILIAWPFLLYWLFTQKNHSYEEWKQSLSLVSIKFLISVLNIAIFYHFYLGIRVIMEDYVYDVSRRSIILRGSLIIIISLIIFNLRNILK